MAFVDAPRDVRDRHLKDRLCQVDADLRSVHVDSFPILWPSGPFVVVGTLVPSGGGVHPITCSWRRPLVRVEFHLCRTTLGAAAEARSVRRRAPTPLTSFRLLLLFDE